MTDNAQEQAALISEWLENVSAPELAQRILSLKHGADYTQLLIHWLMREDGDAVEVIADGSSDASVYDGDRWLHRHAPIYIIPRNTASVNDLALAERLRTTL